MDLKTQIAINQFGQDVRVAKDLLDNFSKLPEIERRLQLHHLSFLLWQSKPLDSDIEYAIKDSFLKPTFTPCVLLRTYGLKTGIQRIIDLPTDEQNKTYTLMLYLFKQAYQRRFKAEKEFSGKWWYSDLSSEANLQSILANNKV